MHHHHLTYEDRCQISALKSRGVSQKEIAEQLGFSPSTICRELKRNQGERGYRHKQAQEKTTQRREEASGNKKKTTKATLDLVISKLKQWWSPEQIAGTLKSNDIAMSYETIYRYIWADKKKGGSLYLYLRRKGKKYTNRANKNAGRGCIPNRRDISERPSIVEEKTRIGDWEGDTIIGAQQQGVIFTLVDRKSKFTFLRAMDGKFAEQVPDIVLDCFANLPREVDNHSITFDNGTEFSHHESITEKTGTKCYFATPYHSWERGLNEHTNGLVRQYFPKKSNLKQYSNEQIQYVEDLLNDRPRKVLGYRTPREVFLGIRRPQKIAIHV